MEKEAALFDSIVSASHTPEEALNQVVHWVGETLRVDRCFLYVRQPEAGKGRIAFCWLKDASIPNVIQPQWQEDAIDLPKEDPLFAAALSAQPSVYVDDVQTAPPHVLNRSFEDRTFGHRALIHAHVTENGQLWGILQPSVFGRPRHWSEPERMWIEGVVPQLVPWIKRFVVEAST